MPKYVLINDQRDWLSTIPSEDVDRTRNAIDTSALLSRQTDLPPNVDPVAGREVDNHKDVHVVVADEASDNYGTSLGDRFRNSLLLIGSSF